MIIPHMMFILVIKFKKLNAESDGFDYYGTWWI
jgi:hypothetical protein